LNALAMAAIRGRQFTEPGSMPYAMLKSLKNEKSGDTSKLGRRRIVNPGERSVRKLRAVKVSCETVVMTLKFL